jgi:hypothetical protein
LGMVSHSRKLETISSTLAPLGTQSIPRRSTPNKMIQMKEYRMKKNQKMNEQPDEKDHA